MHRITVVVQQLHMHACMVDCAESCSTPACRPCCNKQGMACVVLMHAYSKPYVELSCMASGRPVSAL